MRRNRPVCGCGRRACASWFTVVGNKLDYDFGTRIREQSLQDNFLSGLLDIELGEASLRMPVNFLRYLLGWDSPATDDKGGKTPGFGFNGHMFRREIRFIGSCTRNDCPAYVIQPQGLLLRTLAMTNSSTSSLKTMAFGSMSMGIRIWLSRRVFSDATEACQTPLEGKPLIERLVKESSQ